MNKYRLYAHIENTPIKTGEEIEIGVVIGPDLVWKDSIHSLLAHKGHAWTFHIEQALSGVITDLKTYFYLAILNDQAVTNLCVFEYQGVAILAHVYTRPEFRQRGIARQVNRVVMEEFRRRGGKVMTLSTDYDAHPFRLYRSFGFREILAESGCMTWELEPDWQEKRFVPGAPVSVREPVWGDWPHVNLLYHQTGGDWFRSVRYGLYQPKSYEGCFVAERAEQAESFLCTRTLVTKHGVIVGNLVCGPDRRWNGAVSLLDLHVHENYTHEAGKLLEGLECGKTKIISHARADSYKEQALRDAGYVQEGRLTHLLRDMNGFYDIVILVRNAQ